MLNYLRQLKAEGGVVSFDIYTINGYTFLQADVEEVDEVGLLCLSEGCRRAIPWTSVSHIVPNEPGKDCNGE
jgi:sRNA-binding regulator protein Hfq